MAGIFQIETVINIFFQQHFAFLNPVMHFFSFLGDEYFFLLFIPLFLWCIDFGTGMRLGMILVLSNSLNMILKLGFRTPRPYWVDPQVKALRSETSFGLPSGHSQNSAALWGIFAATRSKKWVQVVAVIVIFMVGLSRIQLGVHYLHDVLLGWLLGGLLVFLVLKFEKPVVKWYLSSNPAGRLNLALILSFAMIFLPLLIALLSKNWQLPAIWQTNAISASDVAIDPMSMKNGFTVAGITFGTLLGLSLFLEKNHGIPNTDGTLGIKLARFGIGILGLAIIYFGIKLLSPSGESLIALILRFIRYGLLGAWITAGAPWIFMRLKIMDIEKQGIIE